MSIVKEGLLVDERASITERKVGRIRLLTVSGVSSKIKNSLLKILTFSSIFLTPIRLDFSSQREDDGDPFVGLHLPKKIYLYI